MTVKLNILCPFAFHLSFFLSSPVFAFSSLPQCGWITRFALLEKSAFLFHIVRQFWLRRLRKDRACLFTYRLFLCRCERAWTRGDLSWVDEGSTSFGGNRIRTAEFTGGDCHAKILAWRPQQVHIYCLVPRRVLRRKHRQRLRASKLACHGGRRESLSFTRRRS